MLRRLTLLAVLAALSMGALAPAAQAGWSPVGDVLNVDQSKDALSPPLACGGRVRSADHAPQTPQAPV
jgi:hypothetical protein